ncbi:hypothetical protein WA026_021620 [Henosepilachna vigintioctopunctata]|uniref:Uncharacterized protein n=1 Tax=Henosepilachna vigintioctopunctata TaxID=420089 RepID=A0AAW1V5C4_9CUCU
MRIQNKELKSLCRACLSDSNEMVSLGTANDEDISILDMFRCITNIQFTETWADDYPQNICIICSKNVIDSYKFKKICIESNKLIEENIRLMKDEIQNIKTDEIVVKHFESENEDIYSNNEDYVSNDIIPSNNSDGSTSVESDSEDEIKKRKPRKLRVKKETKEKKKVKSEKFDTKLVLEAIAEFRENHRHKYQKTCMFCKLETVSYIALATHIANFHKEYKGKWCFMCSQVVEDLEDHRKVHTDSENVICKFCSRSAKPAGYVSHLKTHLASKPFQCTYCERGFMRMDSLKTHLKAHANEKPNLDERPHKCSNCGAAFADPTSLGWHASKHGPLKCDKCFKRFKYKKRLLEHECLKEDVEIGKGIWPVKTETIESKIDIMPDFDDLVPKDEKVSLPNFCHPCNRRVKDLLIHSQLYHSSNSDNPSEFQCFVCKKTYDTKSKLRNHFRTHEEKLYSCKQCDKKFKSPSQLRLHEQIHTTDRPFICNVCGKKILFFRRLEEAVL